MTGARRPLRVVPGTCTRATKIAAADDQTEPMIFRQYALGSSPAHRTIAGNDNKSGCLRTSGRCRIPVSRLSSSVTSAILSAGRTDQLHGRYHAPSTFSNRSVAPKTTRAACGPPDRRLPFTLSLRSAPQRFLKDIPTRAPRRP
jgi:hypothetical protein